MWCCAAWNLRESDIKKLDATQRSMFRIMLGIKKRDDETLGEFCHRRNGAITQFMLKYGVQPWSVTYVKRRFSWAGYVARFQQFDPNRITYHALRSKDSQWLKLQSKYLRDERRQGHGRYIHVRRWETLILKHHGPDWLMKAQDLQVWNSML